MALKPLRSTIETDISFFDNDTTAERGGVLVYSTAGSGSAMDQANAVVTYAADPSGYNPAGVLMNDIVNVDLAHYHLNYAKDEVQTGSKVCILRKGTVTTNWLHPSISITVGNAAHVHVSGFFHSTAPAGTQSAGWSKVGYFLSTKDEDGYAKIAVNLPN